MGCAVPEECGLKRMNTKEDAAKAMATATSNLNTWGAVVVVLEGGLLSGPSAHHYKATAQIIKIAKAQMNAELSRYDAALARLRAV